MDQTDGIQEPARGITEWRMTRRVKAGSDYDRRVTGTAITQRIRTERGSDRPNTQLGLNEYTGTGDDYSERKILGQSLPLTVLILCWDVPMFRIAQASLRDQAGLFHRGVDENGTPTRRGSDRVQVKCKSNVQCPVCSDECLPCSGSVEQLLPSLYFSRF